MVKENVPLGELKGADLARLVSPEGIAGYNTVSDEYKLASSTMLMEEHRR